MYALGFMTLPQPTTASVDEDGVITRECHSPCGDKVVDDPGALGETSRTRREHGATPRELRWRGFLPGLNENPVCAG